MSKATPRPMTSGPMRWWARASAMAPDMRAAASGYAPPPPTDQLRGQELADDHLGPQLEGAAQRLVAAGGAVGVEARGVHAAAAREAGGRGGAARGDRRAGPSV